MVEQISGKQPLPEDFGVDLTENLQNQVKEFMSQHANSLEILKGDFEDHFTNSSPLCKNIFQRFLFAAVDHAVFTIKNFLDEHAHAHALLPHDIDQLLSESSAYLKPFATLHTMHTEQTSSHYRGNKLMQATQAKSEIVHTASQAPKTTPSSSLHSLNHQSEAHFEKQLRKMFQQMFNHSPDENYSGQESAKADQQKKLMQQEELVIAHLCLEYVSSKSPLEKDEIYQSISLALQGHLPKVKQEKSDSP